MLKNEECPVATLTAFAMKALLELLHEGVGIHGDAQIREKEVGLNQARELDALFGGVALNFVERDVKTLTSLTGEPVPPPHEVATQKRR